MPTKREIINGALASINTKQVPADADLTPGAADQTQETMTAVALFDARLAALLDLAEWPWGIRRKTLSLATPPEPEGGDYRDQYTLPSDLVRLVGVIKRQDWKQEGNLLLVDAVREDPNDDTVLQPMVIRYIHNSLGVANPPDDPEPPDVLAHMSGGAQLLLQAALGIDLATNFLRDEEQALRLTRFYEFQLRIALTGVKKFVELPTQTFETPLLLPNEARRN